MYYLFHECVDGEDWVLTTALTPDECRERLRAVLKNWYVRIGHDNFFNAPILGSVDDRTFEAKVGGHQGVFIAHGRLDPAPTGTTLSVELSHTFGAWGEVGIVALILLVLFLKALPTPSVGEALLVLLFTAALIAVPLHWQWEKRRLLTFVRTHLDATPTSRALFSPSLDW